MPELPLKERIISYLSLDPLPYRKLWRRGDKIFSTVEIMEEIKKETPLGLEFYYEAEEVLSEQQQPNTIYDLFRNK